MSKPKLKGQGKKSLEGKNTPSQENPPQSTSPLKSTGESKPAAIQPAAEPAPAQPAGETVQVEMLGTQEGEAEPSSLDDLLRGAEERAAASASGETQVEFKRGRGRPKKEALSTDTIEDMLSAGAMLFVVSLSLPEEIKPLDSEVKNACDHLSSIIIRHFPMTKGINPDVIDAMAILGSLGGYYIRTHKAWGAYLENQRQEREREQQKKEQQEGGKEKESPSDKLLLPTTEAEKSLFAKLKPEGSV